MKRERARERERFLLSMSFLFRRARRPLACSPSVAQQACFRCKDCNRVINGSNCAALNGVYYCKTHYNQMLKSSGSGYAPPGFSGGKVKTTDSLLMKSSSSSKCRRSIDVLFVVVVAVIIA
jgi:hypothetical protein